MTNTFSENIHTPKKIVIAGAGAVGWTVAAALANGLDGLDIDIILIDCNDSDDELLPCNTTTPSAHAFNKMLGVVEKHFVTKTHSAYFLATRYLNPASRSDYFMPYSEHGFMMNGISFSNYALLAKSKGDSTPYDAYSLSSAAARLGRFRHPSDKPNSLLSTLEYGFQINTRNVAEYWRNYAINKGVKLIVGHIESASLNEETGEIDSLTLNAAVDSNTGAAQKNIVTADLFIDCTGAQALLIGKVLGVNYESLEKFLPVNRRCYIVNSTQTSGAPYSSVEPVESGIIHDISTQSQRQIAYSYHTDYINDQAAAEYLGKRFNAAEADLKFMSVTSGQRTKFWYKNCISIGSSAGYLHDFLIDQLHLAQSAVLRLITLFPPTKNYDFSASEYNRLTLLEYQHIVDFHQLHFKNQENFDSAYWHSIRDCAMTDRLQHRVSCFLKRGIIPFYEGETISSGTWISLFLGANRWPVSYDPIVDTMEERWIAGQLIKMRKMIADAAQSLPNHQQYLNYINQH